MAKLNDHIITGFQPLEYLIPKPFLHEGSGTFTILGYILKLDTLL